MNYAAHLLWFSVTSIRTPRHLRNERALDAGVEKRTEAGVGEDSHEKMESDSGASLLLKRLREQREHLCGDGFVSK